MASDSGGLVGRTKSEAVHLDNAQQPEVLDVGAIRDRIFKPYGREVTIEGARFRILPLSFGDRMDFRKEVIGDEEEIKNDLEKAAQAVKLSLRVMVQITLDADGKPVFHDDDVEKLFRTPLGSTMQALLKEAQYEMRGGPKGGEPAKESGETPSSSSPA